MKELRGIEKSIGYAATEIAKDIEADCIISLERIEKESYEETPDTIDVQLTFFKKIKPGVFRKTEYKSKIKKTIAHSIAPIKELLSEGINKKYINEGDRVVCVQDESMGTGLKGVLFIFDIDKLFFDISTHKLTENTHSDVVETVINIANEIAKEGREGKKIGTSFVIGDKSEILKHTKQLIINPFMGYPESARKITDPSIKETIKEFAQLDGSFIIDQDGTIVTAGAYLTAPQNNVESLQGFGTRHQACAAITKETNSIAVVVSSTGGNVRVFKEGKISMKI